MSTPAILLVARHGQKENITVDATSTAHDGKVNVSS